MRFKDALYDNSDPLYAPCTKVSKAWRYWAPPNKYVEMGYPKTQIRLEGRIDDGRDAERAAKARELTRQMLASFEDDKPSIQHGTWQWLIARYRSDSYSPLNRSVKSNTAESYRIHLARLEEAIGACDITALDVPTLIRWEDAMKAGHERRAQEQNDRLREKGFAEDRMRPVDARDYVSRMFNMIRMLIGYGVMIDAKGAGRAQAILKQYRVKAPAPRKVFATEAHVAAIVAQSDLDGNAAFSLGYLCQWWLTLRAVDVRGQWLKDKNGKRWADGLTWDMIDKDVRYLRKIVSKTENTTNTAFEFDLSIIPDLQQRFQAVPVEARIGPVIKDKNGRPFDREQWAKMFRRYAVKAGVPREIKAMDTRAGAISHASNLGATLQMTQRQAGHASPAMTEHYTRGHSDVPNQVIQLRTKRTM